MSELDEVIAGLTEAHKANGNLMISLPGGGGINTECSAAYRLA